SISVQANSAAASLSLSADMANSGSIELTSIGSGGNAGINVSSGTLTNNGTITARPDNGGSRSIAGVFVNASSGTLAVNTALSISTTTGQTFTNNGAISVATSQTLTLGGTFVPGGSF